MVFFPPGTTCIGSTVNISTGNVWRGAGSPHHPYGGIGAVPTGSVIKWIGPSSGTMILAQEVQDIAFENLHIWGAKGGKASTLIGLYLSSQNNPPCYHFKMSDCIISECDAGILWGDGLSNHQFDHGIITHCQFIDHTTYGIHINSANSADASRIDNCEFISCEIAGIYLQNYGFMEIQDCIGGGSNDPNAIFIKVTIANNLVINNCQIEGGPQFLNVTNSSNETPTITLINNTVNGAVNINGYVKIVSIGNYFAPTATAPNTVPAALNLQFGTWVGFGDNFPVPVLTPGTQIGDGTTNPIVTINAANGAVYTNYRARHAAVVGYYAVQGEIVLGGSAALGTEQPANIGAAMSLITRSGIAAFAWPGDPATDKKQVVGKYIVPTIDNTYVFQATTVIADATTGGTEPTWPTTIGATVVDHNVVWTNVGHSAEIRYLAPYDQFRSSAPPIASPDPGQGYFRQGTIVWNTNPTPGGNVGWVCTTSGYPGIWKPFGIISA